MTEFEYNAADGVRRSDLWRMEESPEKFRYYADHPVEQTQSMAYGSACHKMVLEPDTFGDEYAIAPVCDRRTKDGKAVWEAFIAENQGKTVIPNDDAVTMAEMEAAIEGCPLANKLLRGKGLTEEPYFWTDRETGEKCKVKADRVVTFNRRKYVVDYKTTTCAETGKFSQDIFKMGYFMQAAMYTEGVMKAKRMKRRPGFLFVAQENKPPYAVNVIEVTDDVMKLGDAKFHELLEKYHECKTVDIWPGFVDGNLPNETEIPGWVMFGGEEE